MNVLVFPSLGDEDSVDISSVATSRDSGDALVASFCDEFDRTLRPPHMNKSPGVAGPSLPSSAVRNPSAWPKRPWSSASPDWPGPVICAHSHGPLSLATFRSIALANVSGSRHKSFNTEPSAPIPPLTTMVSPVLSACPGNPPFGITQTPACLRGAGEVVWFPPTDACIQWPELRTVSSLWSIRTESPAFSRCTVG